MTMPGRVLVTLCTYNERQNIEQLIPDIHRFVPDAEILVIDDNSPDGTGEYIADLAKENPRVHAIHRPGKLGLGTATTAGFRYGIEHGFDFLLNLDADFSHPPRFLPSLLAAANQADVVIGSRYIKGGEIAGWGLSRQLMSRSLNLYARAVLGLSTLDNSGSFRCYRVATLAKVDWSNARATGYAIEEEILYRLKQAGATFVEVPITYEERRFGHTKLHWKEAVAAGWVLMQLRLGK
ncbi:polyprenol monophosphomannose synthase [Planctomicrobium piriforme]|uniref:Dolichol-phosphate mannosyltransferase n=1 Tax=Planctomicrobium piriforme TaxID=1576369 RepID=A0A1I3TNE4_9PLAN|nr:polyprenol monophosphomannose synthase [Planctomicrobium piriforme]SFJ72375.1 dolichol-phosphate mannosyltransferase [Planctomicrobium piriforme]